MASSGNGHVHGDRGKDVHEAVQKAWDKASKHPDRETTFEVAQIFVHGSNPISGYSVVLRPTG